MIAPEPSAEERLRGRPGRARATGGDRFSSVSQFSQFSQFSLKFWDPRIRCLARSAAIIVVSQSTVDMSGSCSFHRRRNFHIRSGTERRGAFWRGVVLYACLLACYWDPVCLLALVFA